MCVSILKEMKYREEKEVQFHDVRKRETSDIMLPDMQSLGKQHCKNMAIDINLPINLKKWIFEN